ncbi:hypothetical protein SISSUDRAFT_1048179 [Sistotremastrum suecicum HHB10207 ss-3]|uniref:Actin cytoskeleton-regulatory complex protein SLA1 n=1 Tax=Sistotremastrum suecicum HHB10207 ss-3 TaxID=1314776 RepID=A0A166CNV2_9AGAM|nr:hypothetical protein SISSUDRAFT_1048179 [Sistotremastrum suecicum HHB10207 ss-3]
MSKHYLALLKVLYDYDQVQSDDEIPVKEDQLVFLLERTDEDWWKVKIKTDVDDENAPSGLVPSAYVEEAPHTAVAKALYDYEAASPGELSVTEDEVLYLYDTEGDWLLVKSERDGGVVGYVPGNYVEQADEHATETEPSQPQHIALPSSPPPQVYVDPAERVAASVAAKPKNDPVETWTLSEVDKKGKKKKGTLGVGNGSIFFASESDKTPVQQWQTAHIDSVKVDKPKHILIEVGGGSPTSLHFQASTKEAGEAIVKKIEHSRDASQTATSPTAISQGPSQASLATSISPSPSPIHTDVSTAASAAKAKNGASVHWAASPNSIIPNSPQEEEDEEEADAAADGLGATALYDFVAGGDDELTVSEGDRLVVLDRTSDDWWTCRNTHGAEGVVPASYIELDAGATEHSNGRRTSEEQEEEEHLTNEDVVDHEEEEAAAAAAARAEEERLERERSEKARRDREREAHERRERERKIRDAEKKAAQQTAADDKKSASRKVSDEGERTHRSKSEGRSSGKSKSSRNGERSASDKPRGPLPTKTRTWHDRTGQFQVDAEFLGINNGKIRLHKANGVVIEVPTDKMSAEDMAYIETQQKSKSASSSASPSRSSRIPDDDDIPLGSLPSASGKKLTQPAAPTTSKSPQPKKGPTIDWFDFFLSAGCDVDECTRYAAAFERDKIDETLLPHIKESTMRSLGLKEGDIIRVIKAIQDRSGKSSGDEGSAAREQMRKDEEFARQLQAQEDGGPEPPRRPNTTSPAPNLFAGPGGALKNNSRRGRPTPSKSTPPVKVDLESISNASDSLAKTSSPGVSSHLTGSSNSLLGSPIGSVPPRPSSGFDDDAWTNRPSSTQPLASTPVVASPPPAPPAPPPPAVNRAASPKAAQRAASPKPSTQDQATFELLAKIGSMRSPSAPVATNPTGLQAGVSTATMTPPPMGYQHGLGMGSSPVPVAQLQAQQTGFPGFTPRGPLAPVPQNQGLLNPLIPTNTGFNSFVPTRPNVPSFQPTNLAPMQPSFLSSQPTGFQPLRPILSQPTGLPNFNNPILPQATGYPNFLPQPTNSNLGNVNGFGGGALGPGSTFGSYNPSPPAASPPPANNVHSPANVFAQMKSGTFANDQAPQSSDKYDALRMGPLTSQPTGWGFQGNGNGYNPGNYNNYSGR